MAAENPEAKAAGAELGKAALTVTKTVNTILLPLAAVNFAFAKAKNYFDAQFQVDLEEKAARIPRSDIVEPKASVAGPALQGLAFSHEEPDLKALYLSLLATAMDRRSAPLAHPAFVEIIRQLDAEEARLASTVLRTGEVAIVEIRHNTTDPEGWSVLLRSLMNFYDPISTQPVEIPRLSAMIDNWVRLGLVNVAYDKFLAAKDAYDWVEARPELARLRAVHGTSSVTFKKGVLTRTALGAQFASVVGILPVPA